MTNLSSYKYKCDMHVHTSPVSKCGDFSPVEVVKKYAALGFNSIAITNHFSQSVLGDFKDKNSFLEYYLNDYLVAKSEGEKKGLHVLAGLEMRFPESNNDYLVYGIDEEDIYTAYDYIFGDYESFYKGFKNDKNIIIQAHPFRNSCTLQRLDIIDGIEVFNMHPGHNSKVALAAKLAKENPRLLITGGTDFHHEGHEGMCALCTKTPITDSSMLADIIRLRDYIFDIWGIKTVI